MKTAVLIRGGSVSPRTEIAGKPPLIIHDNSVDFHRRSCSMRIAVDAKEKRDLAPLPAGTTNPIRRVRSDSDLVRSAPFRSRWSPVVRFEEEKGKANLVMSISPAITEEEEDLVCSGGGMGNGRKVGGGSGGKRGGEANREGDPSIGSYYQEMLKADPANPLLLRNYGRFLHQVEGDLEKAEECYGRAILASPNDGELLSLYGRLVWDSQRDSKRAEIYHERAVEASPDDCYVMGSYAHFLWDADEEEEEEEQEVGRSVSSSTFVEAF